MTNREVLIKSLQDKEADEYTVDYIDCVNSPDCRLDGERSCTECKMRWLEQEWEG